MKFNLIFVFVLVTVLHSAAQKKQGTNLVFVDAQGVLRYTKNKKEATFFGVNYTVPFAYGYRSHKALGINPERAIDADVYHIWRLGLNAFRVHVWDVEISDSLGNLLQNEHLRLFDYLVKKLKERNIKILITPIAFWGNGYPEPDIKTNGFAAVYGKRQSVVTEEAFKAQENYLKQFFEHVNPYTGLTYKDDRDVIATEINNEPQHSGPKGRTTEYITRLKAAILSTGWTKPVFYNISESPAYADAVVKANVDGHSFQWYPAGLVANREIGGNFLPHVDKYVVPFGDSIPAFGRKARMVYEFDAGDVAQPIMYPAMARSFRTAGFVWATQFAYDPMYTAHANTEYQTHYLNLIYTPAKAIGLLIACKAFHHLPREGGWGSFPVDTLFDVFRVSYRLGLAEMNSEEEFYYTGNTSTAPKNISRLKHIAGVGSSPVVQYEGTGTYFFDKLADGLWRLEVLPDAIAVKDPFQKASPKKVVTQIEWRKNKLRLQLPDLGQNFILKQINSAGEVFKAAGNSFEVSPGVYLITNASTAAVTQQGRKRGGVIDTNFFAPDPVTSLPQVVHQPLTEVSADAPPTIKTKITGIKGDDVVSIELRNSTNKWKTLPMVKSSTYDYEATVPADMLTPGIINYRIIVKKKNGMTYTFPGGYAGDPYAWDNYHNESWEMKVAPAGSAVALFDAGRDRNSIVPYITDWQTNKIETVTTSVPGALALRSTITDQPAGSLIGWQFYFSDATRGRSTDLAGFPKVIIKARSLQEQEATVSLITKDAAAFGTKLRLTKEWKEIEIPLSSFQKTAYLLLPRPYPFFQPLWFDAKTTKPFDIADAEKVEFRFPMPKGLIQTSVEVQWIWLSK